MNNYWSGRIVVLSQIRVRVYSYVLDWVLSLLPAGKVYVRSKTNSHIETERRRGGSYVAGLGILSVKDFLVPQRTKHVRVFLGLAGYTIGVSFQIMHQSQHH